MRSENNTIEEALDKYPGLLQTVRLANRFRYPLLSHCAFYNRGGTLRYHAFITKNGLQKNQWLLGILKAMKAKMDKPKYGIFFHKRTHLKKRVYWIGTYTNDRTACAEVVQQIEGCGGQAALKAKIECKKLNLKA